MKAKIKRHSRSALSVLLSLCMLVSCVTVGMIGTDAAQTLDAVGASEDEASVGAAVDDDESVGESSSVKLSCNVIDNWDEKSISKNSPYEFTINSTQTIEFIFKDGSTYYKYDSSQAAPFENTTKKQFSAHKSGTQNLTAVNCSAGTYVIVYKGTNNNDMLYYNFYKKTESYNITKTTSGNGTLTGASTAEKNTSVTLTANPNRGYKLDRTNSTVTKANGDPVLFNGSGDNIVFTMPESNVTANAVFEQAKEYSILASMVTTGEGFIKLSLSSGSTNVGSATADTHQGASLTAYDGETLTVSTTPSAGYKLKKLIINGTEYTSAQTIIISDETTNEDDEVIVSAEFEKGAALANDYTATLGTSITNPPENKPLFSNIKATFFDYYTDNEVSGGWYKGIKAYEDAWVGGIKNNDCRNPYHNLNEALSYYAQKNSIKYPMYFGSFYWDKVYHDPGYYHSSSTYKGDLINDSNGLKNSLGTKDNTLALPGLAGSSLTNGMINYAAYSGSTYNGNGEPMVLFDKEWLSSRTRTTGISGHVVLDIGSTTWADANARMYVALRRNQNGNWWDEYWLELTRVGTSTEYSVEIPAGFEYNNLVLVHFFRFNPGATQPTLGLMTSQAQAQANWNLGTWKTIKDQAPPVSDDYTFKLSSYDAGSWQGKYSGNLASFVNSGFPVRKTTHDGATYYEFDSTDGKDTVYFNGLNFNDLANSTPTIEYTDNTNKSIKNGYNSDEGFFPFDRWDVNKRSGYDNRYGKDLALGMKLEIKFTLGHNADGKLGYILNQAGNAYVQQKFDFSGDDDLWVYVDDNLILDLGGDHSKTVGSINFADSSTNSTYKGTVSVNTDTSLTNATNKAFTIDTNKKVHTMTIYYMERGMHESNLKFGFSMSPLENDFAAENEVDISALNPGITNYTDTFTVTNSSYDSYSSSNVNDHSQNKQYTHYKWSNSASDYVESGNGTSNGSGQFSFTSTQSNQTDYPYKQYAEFDNKLKVGDVLNLSETTSKGYSYDTQYVVTDQENNYDLIKSGNGSTTDKFTFKTTVPNSDPNIDMTSIRVKFKNVLKTQSLYITKEMFNNYITDAKFTIGILLSMWKNGTKTTDLNTNGLQYWSSLDGYATPHYFDDSGKTTILSDEIIRIDGIPQGAKVTVTEYDDEGYELHDLDHASDDNTDYAANLNAGNCSFSLNNTDIVTITNEKVFDLVISKTATDTAGDEYFPDGYFPIAVYEYKNSDYVQITSATIANYKFDGVSTVPTSATGSPAWYFANNYFMIKAGESVTIKDIHSGKKFKVVEYTANLIDGSGTEYSSTDIIPDEVKDAAHVVADSEHSLYGYSDIQFDDANVYVTVENTEYIAPTYNFTVSKVVTGGDSTDYFPIRVDFNGNPITDSTYNTGEFFGYSTTASNTPGGDWYFDENTDYFMVKANKSVTFTNVLSGDKFLVAEDTGNITGYTYSSTSASNGTGTVYTSGNRRGLQNITIADSDVTVTVTNAVVIPTYTLKLTKTTDSPYDYDTAFKVRVQKWNGTAYVDLYTGGNESTPYYGLSGDDHNGNAVTRNALPYSTGSSTQFYYYPVRKGDVLDIPDIIDGDQIRVIEVDPDTSYYTYGSSALSNVTNATTRSAYNTAGVGKGIDFTFDASDVTSGKNLTVTINNVSVKQTVRVYKRTNFNINDGSTFQIHVKWLPYNNGGSYINKEGGVINTDAHVTSTSTTVPTIEAEGKYSLQKDEYVEFTNVPYGSTFQVEETAYGDSNVTQEQRFTFDKLVVDGHEYTENVSLQTFEITKDTNFFVWNKIFKNDVKIKKIINGRAVGETHDTDTVHTFTIDILRNGQGSASYNTTDDSVSYIITDANGNNGTSVNVTAFPFTISLKEDEEVTLNGIYSGSFFTVTETTVGFGYQYNSIEFSNVVDNHPAIAGLPNPTVDSSARSITFQTRNLGITGNASIIFKNEKRPTFKYRITYNYPSRTQFVPYKNLYGNQQYFVEDTISGDDENYDTYFADGKITKALVQAVAPFETNFMIDLALDNANITIEDPETSGSETIYKATATFTGGEATAKKVNFILPYNYTIENHTYGKTLFQATDQNYLGDDADWNETQADILADHLVPYQDNMTAWETVPYIDTDGTTKYKTVYYFTTAPEILYKDGTEMNFLYWSIRSVNKSTGQYEEVARCYDARFNYVIFDDYEITPVYDGFDSALGYDTSGNTESSTAKFATINLLAFSRNQWNSNVWNGTQVKGNGTLQTNLEGRDTVYVDFDVAFEYNNIKLKNHSTIKTGILIENCGKLDVDAHPLNFNDNDVIVPDSGGKTKYQLDYAYYVSKYSDKKDAMEAQLKEYLKSDMGETATNTYKTYVMGLCGSDFTDDMYNGSFEMLKTYNTNGSINNMNRSEIGIGNHVRYITDEGTDIVGDWTIDEVKKNSVFRAYTYIKDAENNIILSEPVYFTVYNTAVLGGQV